MDSPAPDARRDDVTKADVHLEVESGLAETAFHPHAHTAARLVVTDVVHPDCRRVEDDAVLGAWRCADCLKGGP